MVRSMIVAVDTGLEDLTHAMLWLVAYSFLLRVPSEARVCISIKQHVFVLLWMHLLQIRRYL